MEELEILYDSYQKRERTRSARKIEAASYILIFIGLVLYLPLKDTMPLVAQFLASIFFLSAAILQFWTAALHRDFRI